MDWCDQPQAARCILPLISFGTEWIAIFYSLFSDTRLETTVRMAPVRRGTVKYVVIIVAVVLLLLSVAVVVFCREVGE